MDFKTAWFLLKRTLQLEFALLRRLGTERAIAQQQAITRALIWMDRIEARLPGNRNVDGHQ